MNEGLRDIKPLLEIPDYSYAIFLALAFFMGLLVLSLLFILAKKFLVKRKTDQKRLYFERLKNVNWDRPKEAAYEVTFFGRALAEEPKVEEKYKELVAMLEPYKYRKEVPKVDKDTLNYYNLLVHIIDESL